MSRPDTSKLGAGAWSSLVRQRPDKHGDKQPHDSDRSNSGTLAAITCAGIVGEDSVQGQKCGNKRDDDRQDSHDSLQAKVFWRPDCQAP